MEFALKSHGMTKTRVNRIWRAMLSRCRNPKTINYASYGGAGISVCERWKRFENFFVDMGHPPTEKHSLDRKDPKGNYEPNNCRWATQLEQARNTKKTIRLTIGGVTKPMAEWCDERGIGYNAAVKRHYRGLSPESILSPKRLG